MYSTMYDSYCGAILYIARVYHRRGARRWRKVRRINGHAFVAKRLQVSFVCVIYFMSVCIFMYNIILHHILY